MKSDLCLFDAPADVTVTPTQALAYLFCPRFTYYSECLKIAEHEEKRFKVQAGRQVHEQKERQNTDYLRKRLGVVDKQIGVYLCSRKYHVRGIVDELLTLVDGTKAPLEYKFTEYRPYFFKTHRCQLTMQALMIKDHYDCCVKKGYLVYVRSQNRLESIEFSAQDIVFAEKTIAAILEIIQTGFYPMISTNSNKCVDCCYHNICI